MIAASQLRAGMVIRHEGQLYKVLEANYHPGQGKMGGTTHVHLQNLSTGTHWEHSFRSELKIEDLAVEKTPMEFLYRDGEDCYFMNPETYEQVSIPAARIGDRVRFLQPELRVQVEFLDAQPISVVFPDHMELRVADTAPPQHQQDNTWKTAKLENGVEVQVPQFIKTGDWIRLELATLKYMDRAKGASR